MNARTSLTLAGIQTEVCSSHLDTLLVARGDVPQRVPRFGGIGRLHLAARHGLDAGSIADSGIGGQTEIGIDGADLNSRCALKRSRRDERRGEGDSGQKCDVVDHAEDGKAVVGLQRKLMVCPSLC